MMRLLSMCLQIPVKRPAEIRDLLDSLAVRRESFFFLFLKEKKSIRAPWNVVGDERFANWNVASKF